MNDVPSAPIGDFENTLSFPSEETSLGSGLPSHLPQGGHHGRILTEQRRLFTDTVEVIIIQVKYFPYEHVEES
jgi:hypothetical protein